MAIMRMRCRSALSTANITANFLAIADHTYVSAQPAQRR
jgi:hypothetical protein